MATRTAEITERGGGWLERLVSWYSQRNFGMVLEPLRIMARNSWVLAAVSGFEMAMARAGKLDAKLKELAQIKAATMIGCPW